MAYHDELDKSMFKQLRQWLILGNGKLFVRKGACQKLLTDRS